MPPIVDAHTVVSRAMSKPSDRVSGEISLVVTAADTASAQRSGEVAVLATPRTLALAEQAAYLSYAPHLPEHQTTVGVFAEIHHVKATSVGGRVTARVELIEQSERNLSFEFKVTEGPETVAYGTHRRVIVDRSRFPG
jgi:fluoroacetyl-CoA thioesterase